MKPSFLINENGTLPAVSAPKTNTLKVGDILVGCWGYEASIASFVKVVKASATTVDVVELEVINYDYHTAGMYWTSKPGTAERGRVHPRKKVIDGNHIRWNSYCSMWKWNGEPVECYNVH